METTINGGDGRVRCFTDAQTGRMTFIQGDNVATFDAPKQRGGDGAALMETEALTPAQKRLARLRGTSGVQPPIERHEILGEEWFLRRINFEGLNRIAMLTPRDAEGKLVMGADGVLTALLSAMLFVCCVSSETSAAPFFERWEDAYAMAADESEAATVTNNLLFSALLSLNPEIWPEGAEQIEKAEAEGKGDASPLVSSP